MKCPQGHELPHETPTGQCTPLYCGVDGVLDDGTKPNGKKIVRKKRAKAQIDPPKMAEPAPVKAMTVPQRRGLETKLQSEVDNALQEDEVGRQAAMEAAVDAVRGSIGRAGSGLGSYAVRQAFLKTPKGMSNEEAEVWAQSKSLELLPTALGEVEFRLKFGDDDQRYEAAKDVLDMNGMRKRDAINSGGNTIILNLGAGGTPWAKKVVSQAIDGQAEVKALQEGESDK